MDAQAQAGAEVGAVPVRAVESPRTVEELFLFAFATQAEVLHHVRTETLREERARLPEILDAWQRMQVRVTELAEREKGLADTVRVQPVPVEHGAFLQRVTAHPLFQKTFQNLPISFHVVEIDKLVAPQRGVNLTHVTRTLAGIPEKPSFDDLLQICLWPERALEPIHHLEVGRNTHVFSSPVTDVRFLDSFAKDLTADDLQYAETGGLPAAGVLAFVGYGCSSINVFYTGRRMILNNGFHRVYALRSRGVTAIPVVVQHLHNLALEAPEEIIGLPSGYLFRAPRPVLLKDFFEPGFAVTLKTRERIRVVKVTVSASRYDVLV